MRTSVGRGALYLVAAQVVFMGTGTLCTSGLGPVRSITLMCFEGRPEMCHRGVIASELEQRGVNVTHL